MYACMYVSFGQRVQPTLDPYAFSMQMSPKTVNYGRKNLGFGVGFGYSNNTIIFI